MTSRKIALIGGGGFAKEVAEIATQCGYVIAGCYALDPGSFASIHRGYLDELKNDANEYEGVALGVGATDRRSLTRRRALIDWLDAAGLAYPPIVSSSAIIADGAKVGNGAFVAHGAIVGVGAELRPFALVNSGAIIGHDAVLHTNSVVAPGAFIGGGAAIGSSTLIGPLSKVLQGLNIGEDVIVGIGCTALRSLPAGSTVWPRPDRAT